MAQMTPEVSKLLERALSLSVEEQEALADSLISNLGGKVDEGVQAASEAEIGKRVAELDSGKAKDDAMGRSAQTEPSEVIPCPLMQCRAEEMDFLEFPAIRLGYGLAWT